MLKQLLTKTLLVAAGLCTGMSAWADAGDKTTNANIDFSNAISDGVIAGAVNSITIGAGELRSNQSGWLSLYDGSSTVTIPEAQRAGTRDIVHVSFKMAWGNKNNMGSGFKMKDADGEVICSFQFARWDGNAKNANTLGIDMSGLIGAHNNNQPIKERYTLFDITIDYDTKQITSSVFCANTDGKGTTKTETFTTSLTQTNPIAVFEAFGYGVGGNTDRASIIDDLLIETTQGDYTAQTYNYTVNWKLEGSDTPVKTVTRNGEADAAISLYAIDKESFTEGGQKYYYVSDDSEGKKISSEGTTVVTITVREAETWNYTVNAVNEDNMVVGTITTGTVVEGEQASVNYSQYYLANGTLLKADASGTNSYWTKSFSPTANNFDYNITYKASGSVENVVYFTEAEKLEGVTILTGNNANIRCSNAAAAYATSDVTLTTLQPGIYKLGVQAFSPQSSGGRITINVGEDIQFTSGNSNTTMHTSDEFIVAVATDVVLKQGGGNRNGTDFIYIQKTGDIPATVSKSISAAGWATYCSPYALDFSNVKGLTAYIVRGADADANGVLDKEEVTTIPANTGVLLKGAEGSYNIPVVASAEAVIGNKMVGVTAETQLDEKSGWVLMNDATNGLGFYCNENTFTVGANTAYIPVDEDDFKTPPTEGAKTRFFSLDGEDATAINGIESEKNADNAAIYNLAGQRVNGGYKGIVIKNGKKVFVK